MGAPDLALGNLLGSNVFNMVLLLPIDLAYPGRLFADVSTTHALTALATVVVTGIVVMGQLYQSQRRVRLVEPDGSLIVVLVLGSLVMVFFHRDHGIALPPENGAAEALVRPERPG
jgi:cation:H+ antiporter